MKAHRALIAAALLAGPLVWASAASAAVILTFGQSGSGHVVTGTANGAGTSTTITGTNVAVGITQILGGSPTTGYLTFDFTSVGSAATAGGFVTQDFDGTFTITSGLAGTGTNYLSGSFTDAVFGENASLTLSSSDPPDTISFTSSVISDLGNPTGISLSFVDVTPGASIDNTTLASFSSGISGDFSGTPVPEPASLLLIGTALVGLGQIRRRRKSV